LSLLWLRNAWLPPGAALGQLLALQVLTLVLCLWRRWEYAAAVGAAATMAAFAGRFILYYTPEQSLTTDAFAWALLGVFVAYAAAGEALGRVRKELAVAFAAVGGALMALLWTRGGGLPPQAALGQLLALEVLVLGVCLWRRWHRLRAGVLAWTAAAAALVAWPALSPWAWPAKAATLSMPAAHWAVWAWALYIPLLADVLVRAWRRKIGTDESLDATLLALATAALFAGTYVPLRPEYMPWMGLYAAVLGAAAIALAYVLHRFAGRPLLGATLLTKGLVLLVLAVPIQFDRTHITIAWAAQGVAAMALARWLRNKILLIKSPVVLALALAKFIQDSAERLDLLGEPVARFGDVNVSYSLVLGGGLAAGLLAAAAILRAGRHLASQQAEEQTALSLVFTAAGVWVWQTCAYLPAVGASWTWLLLACGLAAVAIWRRSYWLAPLAGVVLAATAVKWLLYDTLVRRLASGPDTWRLVVVNWQFGAGIAVAAALVAFASLIRKRSVPPGPATGAAGKYILSVTLVGAALLVLWCGSFEVDRYFAAAAPGTWADPGQAAQMGHSIWWAFFAAAVLVIGFARHHKPLRYMAMVVFAVTLGKVFLVDMRNVLAVYRILSFVVLGAALLTGSWLYHRATRRLPAEQASE
ncbi:MAG TPA: DUF2339 domain-containing protein, partial [Vicinamibacterales bacterium]|nr:DUF2339 domain-containing protein [Vicinamibacterales bacterium]